MSDPFTGGLAVEIGCTATSGLRMDGAGEPSNAAAYIDPIERIVPLGPEAARLHGSDFYRWGVLKPRPVVADGQFRDELGVTWATSPQGPFAVDHPFAEASAQDVARHPFPPLLPVLQVAAGPSLRTLLDAPTPGIVGTALALSGAWRFLEIFTEDAALTSALLDWAERSACQYYTDLLLRLPRAPDLVVIQDIFGTDQAPFFSEAEFRRFVLPRLSALIASIRTRTNARLCLQVRGAALPLLPLVADLGIEVLGIDHRARGMVAAWSRRACASWWEAASPCTARRIWSHWVVASKPTMCGAPRCSSANWPRRCRQSPHRLPP
ncbi:uroporphyrinogen decarboxylase family protein [Roseixanthobacter glucoisosaccharinicivorans]|uniref:uroporphyrinogen decarboxylase family protein n=1 Tax=Roseixanthobacter glucoisosaccharinicivorans TaxID=3119923 RepID=UPI00372842F4